VDFKGTVEFENLIYKHMRGQISEEEVTEELFAVKVRPLDVVWNGYSLYPPSLESPGVTSRCLTHRVHQGILMARDRRPRNV
jgi:hypothetical protein